MAQKKSILLIPISSLEEQRRFWVRTTWNLVNRSSSPINSICAEDHLPAPNMAKPFFNNLPTLRWCHIRFSHLHTELSFPILPRINQLFLLEHSHGTNRANFHNLGLTICIYQYNHCIFLTKKKKITTEMSTPGSYSFLSISHHLYLVAIGPCMTAHVPREPTYTTSEINLIGHIGSMAQNKW